MQRLLLFDCSQSHRRFWGYFFPFGPPYATRYVFRCPQCRCRAIFLRIFFSHSVFTRNPRHNTRTRCPYTRIYHYSRAMNIIISCTLVFSFRLPVQAVLSPFLRDRSFLTAESVDRDEFVFYYIHIMMPVYTCIRAKVL